MQYQTIPLPKEISEKGSLTLMIAPTPKELLIKKRPLVLICPGGGYRDVSFRESELLALPFLSMGSHAAVLHYSVAPNRYPTQLTELAYCVKYLREKAEEFAIDPEKILLCGCSAGGHLAANLGTCWQEEWLSHRLNATKEAIQPNGMILCYPVITAGNFAHKDSFVALLGDHPDETTLNQVSLEHKVTKDTPPTFLWHTFEDATVPMENSLLFVSAMKKAEVPCEFHLFPQGEHGLSLATEQTASPDGRFLSPTCSQWINLVKTWMENL
jgi:acetyl esterase/lipase